jgi:anti-sigma factor RsiW
MSRDLDAELSELERSLLDRHVAACAACAEFRREVGAFTTQLRAAPLEQLARPVTLPSRQRRVALRPAAVAAAFAVAAAGIGGVLGTRGSHQAARVSAAVARNVDLELQQQRNFQFTQRTLSVRPSLVAASNNGRPGPQLL